MISITGGNDLTLYEVDEAASRIRQEVDEEANIILGATFDSALDGVVRVSVVATGIDQATIDQIEPVGSPPLADGGRARARRSAAPAARRDRAGRSRSSRRRSTAAALDDVEIRPAAPRSTAYAQPFAPAHEEEMIEREFIPPAPEQPALRAPRMPQIEELPPIAQNQLRAHRGEAPSAPPPVETRRRSLLEKLAAFGVSRHEDDAPAPRAIPAPPVPLAPPRPTAAAVHAEYGRTAAPSGRAASGPGPARPAWPRAGPARLARGRPARNSGVSAPAIQLSESANWKSDGRGPRRGRFPLRRLRAFTHRQLLS